MRRTVWMILAAAMLSACGSDDGGSTETFEARTIDGSGNNRANPEWGMAGMPLMRIAPAGYADEMDAPAGPDRPSARAISVACCWQLDPVPNTRGASNYLWQWGQFLDHDITLSEPADPGDPFDIPVPMGDPMFDPMATGEMVIELDRTEAAPGTGGDPTTPRNQMNELTAYVDASNVYGSDEVRAAALRTNDGTGRMLTSDGDLLPFNVAGLPNAEGQASPEGPRTDFFLGGDVRANEQVGLTALHTLFVREHNRWAERIAAEQPALTGEEIYQRARARVAALMQVITYNEFLPMLLGPNALGSYNGYRNDVDASIDVTFSTAAYRVGHTMLGPLLVRIDAAGDEIAEGHLPLRDAFFSPSRILDEGGIDPLLRGLAVTRAQEIDTLVTDDVRNFLFGPPGAGGFDLASLNIQRGRDHGLMDYNSTRMAFGLAPQESFEDISSDPETVERLRAAYPSVDTIDPWVGGLAEDHFDGAMVGELFYKVMVDQFRRLRDGDRFWYERVFSGADLAELEATRLSDVIRRNTGIGDELDDDAFSVE